MVGRHDHERVVPLARGLELGADPAELLVDVADHPVVLGPDLAELGLAGGRCGLGVAEGGLVEGVPVVGRRDRQVHLGRVVRASPAARRGVGGMGPQVGEVGEPGAVLALVPRHEAVRQVGRDPQVLVAVRFLREQGLAARPGVDALLGEPGDPGQVAVGQVGLGAEPREDALVGGEAVIVGVVDLAGIGALVGVAEQRGVIARSAGHAGDVVEAVVERRPVEYHPVVHLVRAGVQAGPPGRAGRRLAVVAGEQRAIAGQAIEVRGAHDGMADGRQAVAAELVQRDQQDVRPGPHGRQAR